MRQELRLDDLPTNFLVGNDRSRKGLMMKLFRVLPYLAALVLTVFPAAAPAQTYPTNDIHVICAFPAGSSADVMVRFYADKLRQLSGRTIVVENKPGAAGNIATEYLARAKPDGHVIYIHAGSIVAASQHLYKKPPVAADAITVAATINKQPFMLAVDAKAPWKTVGELTSHLKTRGDKASYATYTGYGMVMGEMYNQFAGLKAVQVVYKTGADSLNDLSSGAVDFGTYDPVFATAQANSGRLRLLAVSTAERLPSSPTLPTMTEAGVPGINLMSWFAAMIPSATPRPVVERIHAWFNQITNSDEGKAFLLQNGGDPMVLTLAQAEALLRKDIKDWEGFVKLAKIQPQ